MANKSYRLHAGVWEGSITRKFWQALNGILERVDDRIKVLLKYRSWNIDTVLSQVPIHYITFQAFTAAVQGTW